MKTHNPKLALRYCFHSQPLANIMSNFRHVISVQPGLVLSGSVFRLCACIGVGVGSKLIQYHRMELDHTKQNQECN